MKKSNKSLLPIAWLVFLLVSAGVIATYAKVDEIKLLEFDFVATTVGVLLGFGLTIYTFVVQLIQPIIDNVEKKIIDPDRKKNIKNGIIASSKELRDDLWLIFIGLIIVLVIGVISKSVDLQFQFGDKCICHFPEFVFIAVYLLSFRAMYDLMKALFSFGDIAVELLNK